MDGVTSSALSPSSVKANPVRICSLLRVRTVLASSPDTEQNPLSPGVFAQTHVPCVSFVVILVSEIAGQSARETL